MQRLQIFIPSMDLGMEPKTFALLIAILLFLISLLANLLQRRYSKARYDRMLKKEKSIVPLLEGLDKYLDELQWSCIMKMDREGSLKKAIKAISAARDKIERILDGMKTDPSSLRRYRRKEGAWGKNREPQKEKEPIRSTLCARPGVRLSDLMVVEGQSRDNSL